jgi:hypothetical protein
MMTKWLPRTMATGLLGLALAGCVAYEPAPYYYSATPTYYYSPAPAYYAPAPSVSFVFREGGGHRWR